MGFNSGFKGLNVIETVRTNFQDNMKVKIS